MTIKDSELDDIKPISKSINKLRKHSVLPWKVPVTSNDPTETPQYQNSGITELSEKHNNDPTETPQYQNSGITELSEKHNNDPTNNPTSSATVELLKKQTSNQKKPNIELLNGLKKRFLLYVFIKCLRRGSRVSENISIIEAASVIGTKHKTLETIVSRLVKEHFLTRTGQTKKGPGGFCHFEISEDIYQQILSNETFQKDYATCSLNSGDGPMLKHNNTITIPQQLHNSNPTNNPTSSATRPPSMYVGINNNTIHTEPPIQPILDEWADLREIDFATLAPWNIKSSVVETFKKNKWLITREQLEDFIERFIRYFTEAEFEARRASIRSPYSLFLNSVKALSQGEPDPICDVKTQFDLQREIAIKNKQKQLEENKRRFDALEKSLDQCRESEFETWLAKLTLEEQSKLVPPKAMAQVGSIAYRQLLKAYYTEMIWPQFKQTVLNGPRA